MKPEPPILDATIKLTPANASGLVEWQRPALLLMLMAFAMQLSFASWSALQYNFAEELLGFDGAAIGLQQSIREIPGFLSFAAVFFLFAMREQTFAMLSLVLLGVGVAATGYFPTALGFYITTFIGSVGFHYYETMHQSLSLQWLPKNVAARTMGKIVAAGSAAQLIAYAGIFLIGTFFAWSYTTMFLIAGGATLALVVYMRLAFPAFETPTIQRKQLILRKKYWLFYALTFLAGARRQVFLVFASWMMIERFGYAFKDIAALFFVNAAFMLVAAPLIGRLIEKLGERRALLIEYAGLAAVFTAYAFVNDASIAIGLYLVDHALFAMAIAKKTYFQKIADPGDIAGTTGVAFTINHIAAVFIPVSFGVMWMFSSAAVFLAGTAMALCSFVLALLVPHTPRPGYETTLKRRHLAPAP